MPSFPTHRKESWKTRRFRWMMNCFPTYFGTGGRILFISSDWKEIHIRLSLNLFTYNYVGVVYGGSIYSAMDPFYMLQLIHILGKEYVVWDKAANIRFLRPIKKSVCPLFNRRPAHRENQAAGSTNTGNGNHLARRVDRQRRKCLCSYRQGALHCL